MIPWRHSALPVRLRASTGITGRIMPFPPGHFWKKGEFVRYYDVTEIEGYLTDDSDAVFRNIREKLIEGVRKRLVADARVGFLLSGGLDSSLVCAIAARESDEPIKDALGRNGHRSYRP